VIEMRLVYLYVQDRHFDPKNYLSDGYHELFRHLVESKVVDKISAYWIELRSNRKVTHFKSDNYEVASFPRIEDVDIGPEDIVWIRGGWKNWIPRIEEWNKNKQWLLYYGANTGHERWPYWDIVLNDTTFLQGEDTRNRYWLPFQKPIADMFSYKKARLKYDVCLGSSHIHRRKGQYHSFEIIKKYKELFGADLNCVMLGNFRSKESGTAKMKVEVAQHPNIRTPGFLPREEVAEYLYKTKVYMHMGGGGQNDRSVLEAGLCGCHLMLASAKNHPPWIDSDPAIVYVAGKNLDYAQAAKRLHNILPQATSSRKEHIARHFSRKNGMIETVVPLFRDLFEFIRANPKVDVKKMGEQAWKNW